MKPPKKLSITVLDFLPVDAWSEFEQTLISIAQESPYTDGPPHKNKQGLNRLSYHQQEGTSYSYNAGVWGQYTPTPAINFLEQISLSTIYLDYFPSIYFFACTAEFDSEAFGRSDEISFHELRAEFVDFWEEEIVEKLHPLLADNSSLITISGPLTIEYLKYSLDELLEILDPDDSLGPKEKYQDNNLENIRKSELVDKLGINKFGLMSLVSERMGSLGVIAQSKAVQDNFGYQHDGYAFLEFGGDKLSEGSSGFQEIFSSGSHFYSKQMIRFLPLLSSLYLGRFYFNLAEKLNTEIREVTLKDDHTSTKELKKFRSKISSFYERLSEFLDVKMHSLENISLQKKFSENIDDSTEIAYKPGEIGIPSNGIRSLTDDSFNHESVYQKLIQDAKGTMNMVSEQFENLKSEFAVVSEEIQKKIDLDNTEESINLQRKVKYLTWCMFFLTVVLLIFTAVLIRQNG